MRETERSLSPYGKKNDGGDTKDQDLQTQLGKLHDWAAMLSPMVYLK